MTGWVELRCPRSLKAKLHVEAGIIEIKCQHGRDRGGHAFDWFCTRTGRRLSERDVNIRLSGNHAMIREDDVA